MFTDEEQFVISALVDRTFTNPEDELGKAVRGISDGTWTLDDDGNAVPPVAEPVDATPAPTDSAEVADLKRQLAEANTRNDAQAADYAAEEAAEQQGRPQIGGTDNTTAPTVESPAPADVPNTGPTPSNEPTGPTVDPATGLPV